MQKRLMVGLLAGGLLAATSVSPALAGPPILLMGCSDGFSSEFVKPGLVPDRNGNGQICQKLVQGGGDPVLKLIVLTDDHPIGPRLG
jgi:hypothetical protein